jgi:hypothetical protein
MWERDLFGTSLQAILVIPVPYRIEVLSIQAFGTLPFLAILLAHSTQAVGTARFTVSPNSGECGGTYDKMITLSDGYVIALKVSTRDMVA